MLLSLTAGPGQRITFLLICCLFSRLHIWSSLLQVWGLAKYGASNPGACVYHSLTPELHRAAEQSPGPQRLRPGGLCLRNSPSLRPSPPAHPKVQPGSPTSSAFPHSPALRTAESNVTSRPPPALPHPVTSLPTPPPSPNQRQVQNPHFARPQTSIGASFPGPPPAGKTSREPSAEVCQPSEMPASGVQGARAQGSSSISSAPQGARPPPGTQPSQTSGPAFPQRLPGLAHLSNCFLLHRRADAAWV